MKLDYQLTEEDYIEFNLHHMSVSKAYKRAIFSQRCIFFLLLLMLTFLFSRTSELHWSVWAVLFGIMYVFFILFFPKRLKKLTENRIKKMLREGDNSDFLGPQFLEITEAGISKKSNSSEKKNGWDSVQKVEESKNLILIYVSSLSAYMIPKKVFENEEKKNEFLAMIQRMKKA